MQKFEQAPGSKVMFNADVAMGVRSKVPASESPLAQCLAGKGRGEVGAPEVVLKYVLIYKANLTKPLQLS